jgi:hypothetical protein
MSPANVARLQEVAALVDAGQVKPVVSSVTRGKIVLRVAEQ